MITIPTAELVGGITDVLGFAAASKESLNHGILIGWNGDELYFAAHDVLSAGRSAWVPGGGDEADAEVDEGGWEPEWGSNLDGESWKVFISAEDAKEIAKVFKLATKYRLTPVTIKVNTMGNQLIVERSNATGHSQLHAMFRTDEDQARKFPDVQAIGIEARRQTAETDVLSFSPSRLAASGAVRPFGSLFLTSGAVGQPSAVEIGSRFIGFIYEDRDDARKAAYARDHAGSDFLRSGTGVHLSGDRDRTGELADPETGGLI